MKNIQDHNEQLIERIKNHLYLNSNGLSVLGLKGKIGIALFFFHHYKVFSHSNEFNFGIELLKEVSNGGIKDQDHDEITNIAKGFTYFVNQGFIDINIDLFLKDCDSLVLESNSSDFLSKVRTIEYFLQKKQVSPYKNIIIKAFDSLLNHSNSEFCKIDLKDINCNKICFKIILFNLLRDISSILQLKNFHLLLKKKLIKSISKYIREYTPNNEEGNYITHLNNFWLLGCSKEFLNSECGPKISKILYEFLISTSPLDDELKLRTIILLKCSFFKPYQLETTKTQKLYENYFENHFEKIALDGLSLLGISLLSDVDSLTFDDSILSLIPHDKLYNN